jgi:hypothetical protein
MAYRIRAGTPPWRSSGGQSGGAAVVAGYVNRNVVVTAAGLPAFQIAVPQEGQVGKGILPQWALALDVPRIDDEGHIVQVNDRANLKPAFEVTAALAADSKELNDFAHFREFTHVTSPTLLANCPAETRTERVSPHGRSG